VPENCKDIHIGDRVLEVNGVQSFNFQSTESASDLFDTVCLVYIPKEELDKNNGKDKDDDESTASEESVQRRRKGRRSTLEEEARRAGAQRQSSRKLEETLKKQQEEEDDLRRAEVEIRRMGRMDRERQKNQKPPSPPPPPPPASRSSSIQVDRNIGSFSPTPSKGFSKGGEWSKVNANHKTNG
jgi:hypothetical protein